MTRPVYLQAIVGFIVCGLLCAEVSASLFSSGEKKKSKLKSSERELRFLSTKEPQPLRIPAQVNVVLIGFNEDGGHLYEYKGHELEEALLTSMPNHKISCVETGERLNVEFDMAYHVTNVANTYETFLDDHLVYSGDRDANNRPVFDVDAEEAEGFFDGILTTLESGKKSKNSGGEFHDNDGFTVFIVNPEKKKINPKGFKGIRINEGEYAYRYKYHGTSYSQTWVSSKKYVVVDISAGPCQYGSSNAGEGTVTFGSVPSLEAAKMREDIVSSENNLIAFRGLVVSVIMSAVERVFLPDVHSDHVDVPEKVIVPIVVLRNHNHFDPLEKESKSSAEHEDPDYHIDIDYIRSEVQRILLPHQTLVMSGGVHSLHSHKHISMSVASALKSDSVHQASESGSYSLETKMYMDSAILVNQMKGAAEILAANYEGMSHARSNLPPNPGGKGESSASRHAHDESEDFVAEGDAGASPLQFPESHGTRVVPVYVFSLSGVPGDLLFDHEDVVKTTPSTILILQTDEDRASVPYVADGKPVERRPRDVNRQIIAGIAATLGGVTPPHIRYSQIHNRTVIDHLWSVGHHPFGPFSNMASLPQVMVEAVVRNTILSRVHRAVRSARQAVMAIDEFAEGYIVDSFSDVDHDSPMERTWLDHVYETSMGMFGFKLSNHIPLAPRIVMRLHDMVEDLEKQFWTTAEHVFDFQLTPAYEASNMLVLTSQAFHKYAMEELEDARVTMECCTTDHHFRKPDTYYTYIIGGLCMGIIGGLVLQCGNPAHTLGSRRASFRRQ